ISDSRTENYDFTALLKTVQKPAETQANQNRGKGKAAASGGAGEHVIVVRVYDRADNPASAKYVVR
ncbi:MAG TPA: hypothetical protein VLT16_16760, partial [Candidatus Limnocylindrales bacterium]|nr:hypothetical protein [Candidatus Limnocylindrales bacterium]